MLAFVAFRIGAQINRCGTCPLMLIGTALLVTATLLPSIMQTLWQSILLTGLRLTVGRR